MEERIDTSGFPMGFLYTAGQRSGALGENGGQSVLVTEARMLAGHQKEAIVHEGVDGPKWRVTSDEGKHLKGTDLAPFPLGFFNAGMQSDLLGRIISAAKNHRVDLDKANVKLSVKNYYWLTGSFVRGDGKGFADPPEISLHCDPSISDTMTKLLVDAANSSPAIAALRKSLQNTFAIYVNGQRETVQSMRSSDAEDAVDPYMTYSTPPSPLEATPEDLIWKTGAVEDGEVKLAPSGTKTRIIRTVSGRGELVDSNGLVETDTWLEMPGVSHFGLRSDERTEGFHAPSGLALFSAGISFCYLTQLSRYIENMKLDINGIRLVQYSPYTATSSNADAAPVDTHLFLNGRADVETHETLMRVAAETCYLHATLGTPLEPSFKVNGHAVDVLNQT